LAEGYAKAGDLDAARAILDHVNAAEHAESVPGRRCEVCARVVQGPLVCASARVGEQVGSIGAL
jgi:hypothetical protein